MTEEWRYYPKNTKYKISDKGEIMRNERLLTPIKDKNGYLTVKIYAGGKYKTKKIHRLVAETFLKAKSGKNEVNHIDGDKKNNSVSNLEWCNRQENMEHAIRKGLVRKGEKCPNSKLTNNEANKIRLEYRMHLKTQKEIAKEHHISNGQISRIVNLKAYAEA
jgi:hypothetical protein